jgi:hypothetical protein
MRSAGKGVSSNAAAASNRDERLAQVSENLRRTLTEIDDLGLKLAGALLDQVIVEVDRVREQTLT